MKPLKNSIIPINFVREILHDFNKAKSIELLDKFSHLSETMVLDQVNQNQINKERSCFKLHHEKNRQVIFERIIHS